MSTELADLLTSQHKRLVATLMGHLERTVYPVLSIEERRDLREVVVRAIGVYHDAALDCVKVLSAGGTDVTNERLYDLLEQIHRAVYTPKGRT